jgi:hypothetical protein
MIRLLALWALVAITTGAPKAAIVSLDGRTHHLGVSGQPEWDVFAGKVPEGDSLKLTFASHPNEREFTLFIRQDDVKQEWSVTLNGRKLGQLFLMEADLIHTLPLPSGTLREGQNELIIAGKTKEDILIRNIALGDDLKEKLLTSAVSVNVREKATGELVPSRITIVDSNRSLVPIFDYGDTNLATRPGVVYTATGRARFRTLVGKYTLYATRGPEYTLAVARDIDLDREKTIDLMIERTADTRGWISSDTHIHTFSLSKHGDALLRERIITIAGEDIELPISTEHNLHADYRPAIEELHLGKYFTLVPGNEVTTAKGHFNIFPVELSAPPPNAKQENWPELFKEIRATPNVKVAILNHPTDTHSGFTPFASTNFNSITGRNLRGDFDFSFDAMELINSGAMRSDWMEPIRAWFALLNRGYKIVGVGASDSHDVSRFIVGQGRTYIRADDSDVSRIDIEKVCQSLKQGHAVVSLGLIPHLTMQDPEAPDKTAEPGDLLSVRGAGLRARISVDAPLAGPSTPGVALYANGVAGPGMLALGHAREVTQNFPKPPHDTFYVLIASNSSDPVPEWGLARPYQPTSPHFDLQMLGVTNPIWIDADGDGKFTSARDYAKQLMDKRPSLAELFSQLATYDYYVAAHCAEILSQHGQNLASSEITASLEKAAPETQRAFRDYRATITQERSGP